MATLADNENLNQRARKSRLVIFLAAAAVLLTVAGVAIAVFWHYKRQTPEYALALIADAANRQDDEAFSRLIDFQAVAADFVPQITEQAKELYGRGADPKTLLKAEMVASSVLPLFAERVRPLLRQRISEEARPLSGIPLPILVLAAQRYLEIERDGDAAIVRLPSDADGRIILERRDNQWVVVGYRNPVLARDIARRLGDEIIRIAEAGPAAAGKDPLLKSAIDQLLPLLQE